MNQTSKIRTKLNADPLALNHPQAWKIFLVSLLVGCASGLPTGKVEQAQIDPGQFVWRSFELRFEDQSLLAIIYVIGEKELGAYEANTEYWFVNREALSELGAESLESSALNHNTTEIFEPDLNASELQIFTQPVYPKGGWGAAWKHDPVEGGFLFQSDKQALRLFTNAENEISRVVWYQFVEGGTSPNNITPIGSFSVVDSVTVPKGLLGYSIDLDVQ
jgi:hypothetical protein